MRALFKVSAPILALQRLESAEHRRGVGERASLVPALQEHVVVPLEAPRVARTVRGMAAGGSLVHCVGDLHSFAELDETGRMRIVGSGVLGGRHRRVGGDREGILERLGGRIAAFASPEALRLLPRLVGGVSSWASCRGNSKQVAAGVKKTRSGAKEKRGVPIA